MLSLPSLPHHADLDVTHADRRRAVPDVGGLRWLPLAAVRRAPDRPLLADGVAGAPEARRDAGVGAVLQHCTQLAILDLPTDLRAKLEVEAAVVDAPAFVG